MKPNPLRRVVITVNGIADCDLLSAAFHPPLGLGIAKTSRHAHAEGIKANGECVKETHGNQL